MKDAPTSTKAAAEQPPEWAVEEDPDFWGFVRIGNRLRPRKRRNQGITSMAWASRCVSNLSHLKPTSRRVGDAALVRLPPAMAAPTGFHGPRLKSQRTQPNPGIVHSACSAKSV